MNIIIFFLPQLLNAYPLYPLLNVASDECVSNLVRSMPITAKSKELNIGHFRNVKALSLRHHTPSHPLRQAQSKSVIH